VKEKVRARLEKLQNEADREAGTITLASLSFPDLLLLLCEDEQLRALIRDIVAHPESHSRPPREDKHGELYDPGIEPFEAPSLPQPAARIASPDAGDLRAQLAREQTLLKTVRADAELAAAWLGEEAEDEGRQLLRLVICAAQWDLLSELWEKLAVRCKQQQRPASPDELHILSGAVELHNLRWRGRQARFAEVAAGTPYDFERHQRGTHSGDRVQALWLPGLINAGGQLHKKPLVQT
jgi:hypothetical protein